MSQATSSGPGPAEPQPLTPRQADTLRFIQQYRDQYGFPPTVRELSAGIGCRSAGGMNYNLQALQKKGWIQIRPNTSRGITILRELPDE